MLIAPLRETGAARRRREERINRGKATGRGQGLSCSVSRLLRAVYASVCHDACRQIAPCYPVDKVGATAPEVEPIHAHLLFSTDYSFCEIRRNIAAWRDEGRKEDNAGKLMNLFRPLPNANKKQQFCQIVKILLFNEYRKRWHMRKNSQKTLKKTPKNAGKRGGNGGKTKKNKQTAFFFI